MKGFKSFKKVLSLGNSCPDIGNLIVEIQLRIYKTFSEHLGIKPSTDTNKT